MSSSKARNQHLDKIRMQDATDAAAAEFHEVRLCRSEGTIFEVHPPKEVQLMVHARGAKQAPQ